MQQATGRRLPILHYLSDVREGWNQIWRRSHNERGFLSNPSSTHAVNTKPVLYLMACTAASRCTWAASQTCWSHSEKLSVIPSRSAAALLAGHSPVAATFPRSAARSSWPVQRRRSRLRPSQLKNRILSGEVVSWEHVCNRWECFTWIFFTDFRGFCHYCPFRWGIFSLRFKSCDSTFLFMNKTACEIPLNDLTKCYLVQVFDKRY